jgi:hypothetical protein
MHIVEMGRHVDDLFACNNDVCGECANKWVIPSSKVPNLTQLCAIYEWGLAMSSLQRCLRAFRSEWVTLPSACWDEKDAFVQQFILLVMCSHNDS